MSTKSPAKALKPSFELEDNHDGPVCGLDEVGRGPLAGPVVAACVIIPEPVRVMDFIPHIRDSKALGKKMLASLYAEITAHCRWSVVEISPQEIDKINIFQASLKAMRDALYQVEAPAAALVDGKHVPKDMPCSAQAVVKGDSKSVSIAAASIIAKVTRDKIMHNLHAEHPHYGWNTNVGYPSQQHRDAIDAHGITIHHRRTFAPVRNFLEHGATSPKARVTAA
ncbi:MAG: ribonuclease HII [Alphaproteobacteria bacterium]|nr:ribonuclease HII [Alphaproteobacteria bacterium]